MRGAPGATDGTAQVYLGHLLAARAASTRSGCPAAPCSRRPINGDFFGGGGPTTAARRPPGRPGAGPRPGGRVRVAAHRPGRDRGDRAADAGRPAARRRAPAGDRHERVDRAPGATRRRPRRDGRRSSATSRRARRRRSTSPSASDQFGQTLSDRVVGPMFFGDGGATADATRLNVRHTMVDQLTYDPMFGARRTTLPARRPGHPRLGLGPARRRRDRGSAARARRQRPLLPAGRRSRSAARPRSAAT